ncbi:MAG: CRISPR system precrRNA processing endoribonuclease RAMP protein Cas6 [Gemmatales bacterium]|nr:CRISPR system precrRNA processing endoribonuclease RAMP protein Cas6 [Gemmatales bacterium]MDW8386381.1 CRISPR system precrRNA processing endoribonuclease RAMP protein Cas6 [Gemmatales bacterium]
MRGLIAGRLKTLTCRHDPIDRDRLWIYCKGCPFTSDCPYGSTFEPDPLENVTVFVGQEDTVRPCVIDPHFPAPRFAETGSLYTLRVLFIGEKAAAYSGDFWQAARQAGADPDAGLGRDGICFEILERPATDRWHEVELPLSCESHAPRFPDVEVRLTTPLFLRHQDHAGRRYMIHCPSFSDLFRAALRSLGRLYAIYDYPLDADFAGLKAAADQVSFGYADFHPFQQVKTSTRSEQRGLLHGVLGRAVFRDVPEPLVTWMHWAGRLHVGLHRVAGAGGWIVRTLAEPPITQQRVRQKIHRPRRRPHYRHRLH